MTEALDPAEQELVDWTAALAAEPGELAHEGDPPVIDWQTEPWVRGEQVASGSPPVLIPVDRSGTYRLGFDGQRFYCERIGV